MHVIKSEHTHAPVGTFNFPQSVVAKGNFLDSIDTSATLFTVFKSVFLNRGAVARYRALASIIPGRERFSWNLSF